MTRALVGGVAWVLALIWLSPSPFETVWAQALLVLAPLCVLPLGLALVPPGDENHARTRLLRAALLLQPPSALFLASAYLLPQGPYSAALALPWLLTTGLLALFGVLRVGQRGWKRLDEHCMDAGLIYVVVGSGWVMLDRLAVRPLDFEPVIVLLTAIHFHYAGFALPFATALALREATGVVTRLAGLGVIAGVPLVAIGITATQLRFGPFLECLAAWVLATSGMLTAWLQVRLATQSRWSPLARSLWAVSALSLAASMMLAALYGTRFYLPLAWLDIPWMRALHGTANALGFAIPSLWAWNASKRRAG